jgi:hypothetical protein
MIMIMKTYQCQDKRHVLGILSVPRVILRLARCYSGICHLSRVVWFRRYMSTSVWVELINWFAPIQENHHLDIVQQ